MEAKATVKKWMQHGEWARMTRMILEWGIYWRFPYGK